jgi:hypothetical protein
MPKNQVSVEELKCRIIKLKNKAYMDTTLDEAGNKRHYYPGEQEIVQKHLSYVLDILDEYRY